MHTHPRWRSPVQHCAQAGSALTPDIPAQGNEICLLNRGQIDRPPQDRRKSARRAIFAATIPQRDLRGARRGQARYVLCQGTDGHGKSWPVQGVCGREAAYSGPFCALTRSETPRGRDLYQKGCLRHGSADRSAGRSWHRARRRVHHARSPRLGAATAARSSPCRRCPRSRASSCDASDRACRAAGGAIRARRDRAIADSRSRRDGPRRPGTTGAVRALGPRPFSALRGPSSAPTSRPRAGRSAARWWRERPPADPPGGRARVRSGCNAGGVDCLWRVGEQVEDIYVSADGTEDSSGLFER